MPADGAGSAASPVEAVPTPLPAMVLAAPAVTPPADAPDRLAAVAPGGHAFDVTQVDARPRVETSVAPRVADHTGEGAVKEVVILRVLVSSAGRPADVQVLRPSKVDSTVDAAAIAAVRRWRFAPARRRGEAVSCWLSVGVPVAAEGHGGSP